MNFSTVSGSKFLSYFALRKTSVAVVHFGENDVLNPSDFMASPLTEPLPILNVTLPVYMLHVTAVLSNIFFKIDSCVSDNLAKIIFHSFLTAGESFAFMSERSNSFAIFAMETQVYFIVYLG